MMKPWAPALRPLSRVAAALAALALGVLALPMPIAAAADDTPRVTKVEVAGSTVTLTLLVDMYCGNRLADADPYKLQHQVELAPGATTTVTVKVIGTDAAANEKSCTFNIARPWTTGP